ncbi:efflux RND transporter periplasmic adaptor subunit [Psychrosphaera sp.]|nr:efflux RND transporter periplasmic adaptor subunit [Psychrosphaera sp.]
MKYLNATLLLAICSSLLLVGCSEEQETIPTYTVAATNLRVDVPGTGHLEAASSETINSPGRQPMTIAWLAEEYKEVKKGELIVKFDGEKLSIDSRNEQLDMMLIEKDIVKKVTEKNKDETEVKAEKEFVGEEFEFAKSYSVDDLRIYSQLEIIESMENTEFLSAKDEFLDWKKGSIREQSQSAVDVLDIQKSGHQSKLDQHQQALSLLEVRAPFDGLLVYEKNWRGESATVGQTVFPGSAVAKIPNLSQMQAKLFVLEKEAIGLGKDQSVSLTLDAYPNKVFTGKVVEVAGFARTIQRGNPVKFFEVTVSISQAGSDTFRPGRKLSATIHVEAFDQKLVAPLQAIHNEDGGNFVYVKQGNRFKKQPISTGAKNLFLVEVTSGLNEGDQIALSTPGENKHG